METEDIFNLPQLKSLGELEERRAQIARKIESGDFADQQIKSAYMSAIILLESQINETAGSDELQNRLAAVGETALRGVEELKPLEEILPPEQITPLRDAYEARMARISSFFNKYHPATEDAKKYVEKISALGHGLQPVVEVTEVPDTSPEPADYETDTSPERQKQKIRIRIGENSVQIGRRGSIFKFASQTRGTNREYSTERRKAFIYLLTHEGETVSGSEVLQAAFGDERLSVSLEQWRNMSTRVREWIQSAPTYKKSPLILFNGKRGSGAAYTTNPAYSFDIVYDNPALLDEKDAAFKSSKPSSAKGNMDRRFETAFIPQESDFYLTAHHLSKFNLLLEQSGIPKINEEMLKELEPYAPDLSDIRGNDEAIKAYRLQALERVKVFLDDETRLFNFLDNTAQESAEYRFINFISGLDETERDFVDRLFRARFHTEPEIHHGTLNGTRTQVLDENDLEILPLKYNNPDFIIEIEEPHRTPADSPEIEKAQELPKPQEVGKSRPRTGFETLPNRAEIINCLEEITARFIEHSIDPEKKYKRHILQKAVPNFTASRSISFKSRLNKKRSDSLWAVEEVYLAALMRSPALQNIVSSKHHAKAVERLIEVEKQKLASFLQAKN